MATRADHYQWADELVWIARRTIRDSGPQALAEAAPTVALWLAAAQVHATLAAAGPGVEAEVQKVERDAAAAVAATEGTQRERQAARPPLRGSTPAERHADANPGHAITFNAQGEGFCSDCPWQSPNMPTMLVERDGVPEAVRPKPDRPDGAQ